MLLKIGHAAEYKIEHLLSLAIDIRDIGLLKSSATSVRIVEARNNDSASVYELKIKSENSLNKAR